MAIALGRQKRCRVVEMHQPESVQQAPVSELGHHALQTVGLMDGVSGSEDMSGVQTQTIARTGDVLAVVQILEQRLDLGKSPAHRGPRARAGLQQ
jgi:hypothetical protein